MRLNKRLKSTEKKQRKAMIMVGREKAGHHVVLEGQHESDREEVEEEGDKQRETL